MGRVGEGETGEREKGEEVKGSLSLWHILDCQCLALVAHAHTHFDLLFFEKIPDYFCCINIATGFTDNPFTKILITPGPGMSSTFNYVENNFRIVFFVHDIVVSEPWCHHQDHYRAKSVTDRIRGTTVIFYPEHH